MKKYRGVNPLYNRGNGPVIRRNFTANLKLQNRPNRPLSVNDGRIGYLAKIELETLNKKRGKE